MPNDQQHQEPTKHAEGGGTRAVLRPRRLRTAIPGAGGAAPQQQQQQKNTTACRRKASRQPSTAHSINNSNEQQPHKGAADQVHVAVGIELSSFQKGDTLGRWTIIKKLGEGGFGAVFEVQNSKGEVYAMKTERANEQVKVLKMEVFVLLELKKARCRHFCELVDRGSIKGYNYIVMTLVGPSFQDLRKMYADPVKQKFSLGCALSVGIQCVEAIEELHTVGYLHRDIKPGNFAIGRNEPRRIYMLDFGMARRFLDQNKQIRPPRWAAGFRGTIRYAPLSCHENMEQSRKDDLETWLYMQIELTKGALPWRHLEDKAEVGKYKDRCRTEAFKELFGGCPREYVEIMEYVDALRYYDTPDYKRVYKLLRSAIETNNLKEFPYDWESALLATDKH